MCELVITISNKIKHDIEYNQYETKREEGEGIMF